MGKVLMPQLGFDMREGKLVRWLKKPGDTVQANEPIAEIETDKAVMEIEAFESGVVSRLLVEEGAVVPVGEPIAVLNEDAEGSPGEKTTAVPDAGQAPAPGATARAEASGEPQAAARLAAEPSPDTGDRIKASPLARRLAAELGIDLRSVKGTGPGGRIVQADVEAAAAALSRSAEGAPRATVPAESPAGERQPEAMPLLPKGGQVEPLTRMRQIIAERMSASKQQAPHFYLTLSIDMGEALAFRGQFNATVGEESRASVNDLIVKACGLALFAYPRLAATYTPEGIRYAESADVSIAVAVDNGLVTPVVRGCHYKSLDAIAREARALIELARQGRLTPDQYRGGTFTVSNLGMYGIEEFQAIINPPQAAILAVGAITDTPVVRDGQVVVRPMMRVTLSADHRVTDGAEAALFLNELKAILEQPLRLLLPPGLPAKGDTK